MATLQQRLERIKNYSTKYELALIGPAGEKYLIIYTGRLSKAGVWTALTHRYDDLVRVTGQTEWQVDRQGATSGAWRVVWTHRTQRECYIQGELAFICDV